MILQEDDITQEFAENLLDKVHLAMSKINPGWQDLAMTDSDSTQTIVQITKTKIRGYKWVMKSTGRGFDKTAKIRLSDELRKLGEEEIPLYLNPNPSSTTGEFPQLADDRFEKIQKSKLPSQAQLKAGNYKKKHCRIMGLNIAIENSKNSYRSGIDPSGKEWKCKIYYDYGYIKRTLGADGDHVDVFVGSNKNSEIVFIINQVDPKTKKFDEHKVMLGFSSLEEAKNGYLKNYEKKWQGVGSIVSLTLEQFKIWLEKGSQKRELVDPKIEFLKSDLAQLLKKQ